MREKDGGEDEDLLDGGGRGSQEKVPSSSMGNREGVGGETCMKERDSVGQGTQ